jgi:O-methyltransferase.
VQAWHKKKSARLVACLLMQHKFCWKPH